MGQVEQQIDSVQDLVAVIRMWTELIAGSRELKERFNL
jgi:hypothetical protein